MTAGEAKCRLPFGPLDERALLVCIDMQRVFLEPGEWFCPGGLAILPAVKTLAGLAPGRCLFTRFITARNPDAASGQWRRYYRRWQSVTLEKIGTAAMDLHAELQPLARPDLVFDKTTHDAFQSRAFAEAIEKRAPSALILFGVETDVCVLASAMTAVDLGLRVILPRDALASSVAASHDACLAHVFPRFDEQIEIVDSRDVVEAWR